MATKKQASFENKLNTLESLVDKLEQGDLPLEQALKEFSQGINIARECQKDLQAAEQKVEILMQKTTDAKPQKHIPELGEDESDD